MKKFIVCLCLLASLNAFAGFGGSRGGSFGGGRSFSGSSFRSSGSSFGGFRSSSGLGARSVTIARPAAPSYRAPSYSAPTNTVIHHDSGGSGFMNGMIMGHLMSRPAPVVVAGSTGVVSPGAVAVAPTTVVADTWSFFDTLFVLIILAIFAWIIYLIFFRERRYV